MINFDILKLQVEVKRLRAENARLTVEAAENQEMIEGLRAAMICFLKMKDKDHA